MFDDAPVVHTHHVNGAEVDGAPGRIDSEQCAEMGPAVGLEGGHYVTIDCLPTDFGTKFWECGARSSEEHPHAGLVGRGLGLRCVIDKSSAKSSSNRLQKSPSP